METYLKLNRKEQRFIDEWILEGCRTKAMRKIRPKAKRPRDLAYQMCLRPEILQAYEERKAQAIEETKDRLQAAMRQAANRATARRIAIRGPDGNILPVEQWPEGVEDCVEGFELDPLTGKITKIRMAPLNEATRLFLESQKVLVKRNSLEGPDGKPVPAGVARLMIVTQEEAKKLDSELDAEV